MPATMPRPDQLQRFAERAPEGLVYMLNLLKFKERADYPDGRETDLTGAEAYGVYAQGVAPLLDEVGGRGVFFGACNALVIGDGDESPYDSVAVVEYPSLEAFQKMTSTDSYAAVAVHRTAGLDHQLLINLLSAEQALAFAGRA